MNTGSFGRGQAATGSRSQANWYNGLSNNLGSARLSAGFQYPPREGDVVTLLRKNSAGAINGIFTGWPEGTTRKVGDVTVRASNLRGNGNDFTFTVTNTAMALSGYRLAEGNGNQTVEPDEC